MLGFLNVIASVDIVENKSQNKDIKVSEIWWKKYFFKTQKLGFIIQARTNSK